MIWVMLRNGESGKVSNIINPSPDRNYYIEATLIFNERKARKKGGRPLREIAS